MLYPYLQCSHGQIQLIQADLRPQYPSHPRPSPLAHRQSCLVDSALTTGLSQCPTTTGAGFLARLSISLSLSLCLSLIFTWSLSGGSLSLSLSRSLSLSHPLFLSFFLSFSLPCLLFWCVEFGARFLRWCTPCFPSLALSVCVCVSLSLSLSVSLTCSLSRSLSLNHSLSLSLSLPFVV